MKKLLDDLLAGISIILFLFFIMFIIIVFNFLITCFVKALNS